MLLDGRDQLPFVNILAVRLAGQQRAGAGGARAVELLANARATMPEVSLCLSRSCLGNAFDQVQCCQHEHLFRFGFDAEELALR